MNIEKLKFEENSIKKKRSKRFGEKWPVVYILNNNKEAYIGETTNAYLRVSQHLKNVKREDLKNIYMIYDEEFNKSAILDIESSLIK